MNKMFWKKNGSTILTVAGASGLVVTTVLAVKATPKALQRIEEAKEEKGGELSKWEVFNVTAPVYIPTVLVGAGSIACMFGANVLNQRQQASLMSAYALLDGSYKEYKNKVNELYGEDAEGRVETEIAKDHYNNVEIVVSENKRLFYEPFSNRYFESTNERVLWAEYELNRLLALQDGAFLNEFYDFLGLEPIPSGTELGWSQPILESMYWTNWVDFDHSTVVMDDGTECTMVVMRQEPVIDFAYY